jgi:hypothetical protein
MTHRYTLTGTGRRPVLWGAAALGATLAGVACGLGASWTVWAFLGTYGVVIGALLVADARRETAGAAPDAATGAEPLPLQHGARG